MSFGGVLLLVFAAVFAGAIVWSNIRIVRMLMQDEDEKESDGGHWFHVERLRARNQRPE